MKTGQEDPVIRKLIPHMSQLAERGGKNGPLLNDKLLLMASVCWLARTLMSFYPRGASTAPRRSRVLCLLNPDGLNLRDIQFLSHPIFVIDTLNSNGRIHLTIRAAHSVFTILRFMCDETSQMRR